MMGPELNLFEQQEKTRLMVSILENISACTKNTYGIKGGSALNIFYGLPRFSENMDFQGKNPVDIMGAILEGARKSNLGGFELIPKKMTQTVNRYMLHFNFENKVADTLKIECSFRGEWNQKNIDVIDNCSVMCLPFIANGKKLAFLNREKPRDVYDICFLLKNYSDCFGKEDVAEIYNHINNLGMDRIFDNMESNIKFENDWIFKNIDCEETVLELFRIARELAVESQKM